MNRDKIALEAKHFLRSAAESMNLAYFTSHLNQETADIHYTNALADLAKANETVASYNPHPTINPHHSGYLADDETRATECPHCSFEDGYDSEKRCPVCKLWDEDDDDAKRFQFKNMIENMSNEDLDKAFSLIVSEVLS